MARQKIRILFFVSLGILLLVSMGALAGCGYDHPTPCPAPVMPGFASPGDLIKLKGDGFCTEDDRGRADWSWWS